MIKIEEFCTDLTMKMSNCCHVFAQDRTVGDRFWEHVQTHIPNGSPALETQGLEVKSPGSGPNNSETGNPERS